MAPLTTQSAPQHTERQPLRRATYVHVSDLISAYNIDHVQLEREIARVSAKRSKLLRTSGADATTAAAAATTSEKTGSQKSDLPLTRGVIGDSARIGSSDGNSDSNSDGIPVPDEDTDLEGPIIPQKRLQPPRGGFNLCV